MPPHTRTTAGKSTGRSDNVAAERRNGQPKSAATVSTPAAVPGGHSVTLRLPLPDLGAIRGRRLLWYGGLGALAALGVLDWPVALVAGAGTLIATRSRNDSPPEPPHGDDQRSRRN